MQTRELHDSKPATLQAAGNTGRLERGLLFLKRCVLNLGVLTLLLSAAQAGTYLTLSTAPGGATIGGAGSAFTTSFGNVNALGIGPASQANVSINAQANGALYYTQVKATIGALFGTSYLTAYVSTNFAHPAAIVMYACPTTSACNTPGNYSALSTNSAAPTAIVASPGVANGTAVTFGVAVWLPDNDGASAFAGAENATITFNVVDHIGGFGDFNL